MKSWLKISAISIGLSFTFHATAGDAEVQEFRTQITPGAGEDSRGEEPAFRHGRGQISEGRHRLIRTTDEETRVQ